MLYFTRWKALAIILTALVVCLCAVPNFFPEATVKTWPAWAQRRLVLGLDLQGGSYLLLEVDANCGQEGQARPGARRRAPRAARGQDRLYRPRRPSDSVEVRITKDTELQTALDKTARAVAAAGRLARLQRPAHPRGRRCRRRADPADGSAGRDHRPHPAIGRAVDPDRRAPRQRARHRRALDPASGQDRILVQVPGLQDPTRLEGLLGKTAKMDFRMVDTTVPPDQALQGRVPPDSEVLPSADQPNTRLMSSRSRCWSPAAI